MHGSETPALCGESCGHVHPLEFLIAPPIILYECQKKGFTKFAFRKLLILKDATLLVWTSKWLPGKEKAGASSRTPNAVSNAVNYTKEEEKVKEKFREFLLTRPLRTKLYCRGA